MRWCRSTWEALLKSAVANLCSQYLLQINTTICTAESTVWEKQITSIYFVQFCQNIPYFGPLPLYSCYESLIHPFIAVIVSIVHFNGLIVSQFSHCTVYVVLTTAHSELQAGINI